VGQRAVITPLDEFEFHHTLQQQRGVSLVIFTGRSCSSCHHWLQLLEQHQQHHPERSIFQVDAERSMALTHEFEVFHLPALFLYRDGQYHCPLQSVASSSALKSAIEEALNSAPQEAP